MDNEKENNDFLKIEKINDLLKNVKNTKNNNNENTISQKVYDIYNEFILICFSDSLNKESFSIINF